MELAESILVAEAASPIMVKIIQRVVQGSGISSFIRHLLKAALQLLAAFNIAFRSSCVRT